MRGEGYGGSGDEARSWEGSLEFGEGAGGEETERRARGRSNRWRPEAAAMAMGRGWRGSEARGREQRVVGDCEGARGLLI